MRILLLMLGLLLNFSVAAQDAAGGWKALADGGYTVIMRHALTDPPRGEEPANFTFDDCSTQRGLGKTGRDDMARLAAAFKQRKISVGDLYSSRYCRCVETAELAFGKPRIWDVLNGYRGDEPYWEHFKWDDMQAIRQRLSEAPRNGNRILVTHNTHIKALLDLWVEPGELVVIRPLGRMFLTVVGRIKPGDY